MFRDDQGMICGILSHDLLLYPSLRTKTNMAFAGSIAELSEHEMSYQTLDSEDVRVAEKHIEAWLQPDIWRKIQYDTYALKLNQFKRLREHSTITGNIRLPVIRYQKGMSRGVYLSNVRDLDFSQVCGLFYYYEPNSVVWLLCNKILIVPNKITGLYLLSANRRLIVKFSEMGTGRLLSGKGKAYYEQYMIPQMENFEDNLKEDATYQFSDDPSDAVGLQRLLCFDMSTVKRHISMNYAMEDPLDQPLCYMARKMGYDAVVLTHMTGQNRMVSEILDTRRGTSFNSLRRTPFDWKSIQHTDPPPIDQQGMGYLCHATKRNQHQCTNMATYPPNKPISCGISAHKKQLHVI